MDDIWGCECPPTKQPAASLRRLDEPMGALSCEPRGSVVAEAVGMMFFAKGGGELPVGEGVIRERGFTQGHGIKTADA